MDFFERQDQARRSTKWLILYFAAGVAMLIGSLYLAAALIFTGINSRHHRSYYDDQAVQSHSLWDPQLFLGVSVATLAIIGLGSAFKTLELAQGGSAVASMLGGRPVSPATTDPDERKLLNVVEEMAIASGVPVPQVYVLPEEHGINAFAAGHSTSDAVVTVTEGSLRLLSRDELQGVIGHEFSHILNGDMRLNLRLMGIIFGIVCLAVIGRILLYTRTSSSDRRDRNPLPLLGLALVIIGWAGVFFGRLIQAAVSRQRESLADASAVQFTRNPAGLAGALKKIGGLSYGSRIAAPHAEEASHMFFSNGMGESLFSLMETHPPLVDRIRALDPTFDGTFPEVEEAGEALASPPRLAQRPPPFFGPGSRTQAPVAGLAGSPVFAARSILANTGAPTPAHLTYAADLRGSIPTRLQVAARDPLGACTLVYALLLSDEEAARSKQLQELNGATSASVAQETLRVYPEVQAIATRAKLPLVDLALPGLRHMSPGQFEQFRAAVQALIESDEEVDLFEYVLQKIVLRHLAPHFVQARKPVVQFYALRPLAPDCAVLLSALAYIGQSEPDKVAFAFQQGAQSLSYAAQAELPLMPEAECDLSQVDAALNRLAQAVPQIKKNVLNACAQTVAADGLIQELEAELLRAIADALDCPLPPFLAEVVQSVPSDE
jgi:Zn-dependent protease with chaperone function